jgi:hypothetical protein
MPAKVLALAHYPPSYTQALPPIFVATGACLVIWFLTQALGTTLVANEQQGQLSRGALGAAFLAAPASIVGTWLTHHYLGNGAIGAVLADNFVEGCMLFYYISVLPRSLFPRETLAYVFRVSVCAAAMAVVVLLLGNRFGLVALVPGVLTYAAGCWVLKCIGEQDLALMRSILGRRFQAVTP